jgi:hypothetical protein
MKFLALRLNMSARIYVSIAFPHGRSAIIRVINRLRVDSDATLTRDPSMVRFVLYTSMVFITAFVGVSWAMRGFPVTFSGPVSVGPLQPTVTTTFGDNSSEKKRELLVEEQLRNPEDPKRNPLRADALQAATGYALSPCDTTMKIKTLGNSARTISRSNGRPPTTNGSTG